jgi:hypothetical protein
MNWIVLKKEIPLKEATYMPKRHLENIPANNYYEPSEGLLVDIYEEDKWILYVDDWSF